MATAPDTWTPIRVDTNRATNPGFETTADPWASTRPYNTKTNVLAAMGLDAAGAFTGTNGLKLTLGASNSTSSSWISYDNPVGPYATIRAKATPAAGHTTIPGFYVIKPIQADGTVVPASWSASYSGEGGNFTLTTSWQKISMTLNPAWLTNGLYPTMTGTRLFICLGAFITGDTLAGDVVYLDMFTDVAYSGLSFDGYYPGTGTPSMDIENRYDWTGTPYASTSTKTPLRKVHYPASIYLGTPFTVEGTGYPAGTAISVVEATWGEITEAATADSSGNWSVTMTIPANTNPDVGPVAGSGYLMVSPSTGSTIYTTSPTYMTYLDPAPAPAGVNAQVFVDGAAVNVTEMRISDGGTLIKITELGT